MFHSGQYRSGISHSGCGRTRGVNLAVLVCSNACSSSCQLEDVDVLVADHVSRVHKTNFLASWEEIGDDYEMQDTYALTQMNSLEGKGAFRFDVCLPLLLLIIA